MTQESISGRCHCGGISFSLINARGSLYCHCSICRRTTGAPFIAAVSVKPQDADLTCAEDVSLEAYATSSYLTRHRCSRCGSSIFNAIRMSNGVKLDNFMVGLLDEPSVPARTHHIYYADRIIDIEDGLPKFDGFGMP